MAKPNRKKRSVIRWTKRILLIAGALGVVVMIVRALLPEAVAVDTALATRGPLEVEVREDGQTRVRDRYVIAAPISGELERITVDAGARVDAGTVVARIESPPPALLDARTRSETHARLAAARARERQAATAVARARQAKDLAALEAKRAQALHAGGAISGAQRDRAGTAANLAIEDLAAAEHERAAAASEALALRAILEPRRATGAPFEVKAPTRGTVLRVVRESAGPVAAGTSLLEIGDPASLEIVIDVLSRDAERIAPGMAVEIDTSAGRPLRGTVTLVEPSAFTRVSALGVEEQRVNVIVCFDGGAQIGDAFRVDARIIVWRGEDVLRVPASALFRDHGRWAVYVVADRRAHLRAVDIGHRGRLDVEITRGLLPGERVILHPSDQVHDAQRVALRDPELPGR
jgi:HlyD family secretion protein